MNAETYWKSLKGEEYRRIVTERSTNGHGSYLAQERFLDRLFREKAKAHDYWPYRLLEIGCGYGRHAEYLTKIPDVVYTGFDFSSGMLSAVNEKTHGGVFVYAEKLEALRNRKWLFDGCLTVSVLIHNTPDDVVDLLKFAATKLDVADFYACENKTHTGNSVFVSAEHGGCWLHDYAALAEKADYVCEEITRPGWMSEETRALGVTLSWAETHAVYRLRPKNTVGK